MKIVGLIVFKTGVLNGTKGYTVFIKNKTVANNTTI